MTRPIITLLTDFGLSDYFVSAMKGVILGICPEVHLVDITHDVSPWQVSQGAWMLDQAWRTFPPGTIHVAVVDPGVGSDRRPLLAKASGHSWVAPDNGLLTRVLASAENPSVTEINAAKYFRHPVSSTFHGRDIFAPVAAWLARGIPATDFGPQVNNVITLSPQIPVQTGPCEWRGEILWIDRFGNIVTSFDSGKFAWVEDQRFWLEFGEHHSTRFARFYRSMEPDRIYVTAGSSGHLEVVMNKRHAASTLGAVVDLPVTLRSNLPIIPSVICE